MEVTQGITGLVCSSFLLQFLHPCKACSILWTRFNFTNFLLDCFFCQIETGIFMVVLTDS